MSTDTWCEIRATADSFIVFRVRKIPATGRWARMRRLKFQEERTALGAFRSSMFKIEVTRKLNSPGHGSVHLEGDDLISSLLLKSEEAP